MNTLVESDLVNFLNEYQSFWQWKGHKHVAQLASGKLSDFFANLSPVYQNIWMQDIVCQELVDRFFLEHRPFSSNLWIIGPSMGTVGLIQSVARVIIGTAGYGRLSYTRVQCAYTEKVELCSRNTMSGDEEVTVKMELKRFNLGNNPDVILVEDVMTTGGSMKKTEDAIRAKAEGEVNIIGRITVIDRRIKGDELPVTSLLRVYPRTWDTVTDLPPEMKNCIPLRPKANWEKLTTEMLNTEGN